MTAAQLDEFAAFCEMGMLCEGPLDGNDIVLGPCPDCDRPGCESTADGLCGMTFMYNLSVEEALHEMIEMFMPHVPGDAYGWPHTRAGWDARAAFCWRMAEMIEKEATT